MKRFTLNILALLSVALLASTIYLMVRTRHHADCCALFLRRDTVQCIASRQGKCVLFFSNISVESPSLVETTSGTLDEFDALYQPVVSGLKVKTDRFGCTLGTSEKDAFGIVDGHFALIEFPLWFWFLPELFFPLLWLRSVRERRGRQGKGLCRNCGYDIRATPDRCPECGWATAPASTATIQSSA